MAETQSPGDIHPLSPDDLSALLASHAAPCISIYFPVVAAFPGALENGSRLKELIHVAERELLQRYAEKDVRPLVERFQQLAQGREFWSARKAALAVFCSPDLFMALDLPRTVVETVVVSDTFHIKPLVRMLQTAGRFQVLGLTRKNVRLFEGDRDSLREIQLKGVPADMYQAYGTEVNTPHSAQTVERGLNHGTREKTAGTPGEAGHAGGIPETGAMHLTTYFRIIDQAIWENHSRATKLPLILCALEENQSAFRSISKNDHLVDTGIVLDPAHVPLERIRDEAWKIMEPRHAERVQMLVDAFQAARARQLGSAEVVQVAEAAAVGRVDTLLIDEQKHLPGKVARFSGQLSPMSGNTPLVDDVLDDTAEIVMRNGGTVLVLPPEQMPTDTGLAAIFRY